MRRYALQIILSGAVFVGLLFVGLQLRRGWGRGLRAAIVLVVAAGLTYGGYTALRWWLVRGGLGSGEMQSNMYIVDWLNNPRAELATREEHLCEDAPFLLPSVGFVGLLWRDPAPPYNTGRRHTGLDIFGDGAPGTVPVLAAADGWLTRREDWKSTVAIRHDDPLQPDRTIWTYYTHMASRNGMLSYINAAFPPGTSGVFVKRGALLGYQGEFAGTGSPIAMHVHVSIVRSDAEGVLLNEAILDNTLDPSPYFGLMLNIDDAPTRPIRCTS